MAGITSGCLTREALEAVISHHRTRRNVRALRQLHVVITDRAIDIERIGWPLLAASWRESACRVQQVIEELTAAEAA